MNLPPGATCEEIDRVFGSDEISANADLIAAGAVESFNNCLSQRVTNYFATHLEQEDDCEWMLRIKAPCPGATLGRHLVEELSLALMAFAISLQMECER